MQAAGFTASDTDAFREGLADVTAAALTAGADGIAAYVAEPEKLFSDIAFQAGGSSPSSATERLDRTAQLSRNIPVLNSSTARIYRRVVPQGSGRAGRNEPIGVFPLSDVDPNRCISIPARYGQPAGRKAEA